MYVCMFADDEAVRIPGVDAQRAPTGDHAHVQLGAVRTGVQPDAVGGHVVARARIERAANDPLAVDRLVAADAGGGQERIDLIVGGDVEVVQIETVVDPIDLRHSGTNSFSRGQAART